MAHLTLLVFAAVSTFTYHALTTSVSSSATVHTIPANAATILGRCSSLTLAPGPPDDFHERTQSDRYEAGTKPTLIKNAKIWTGEDDGTKVVHGDILLDKGIIKKIGKVDAKAYGSDLDVVDAQGAWVTPGIVDLHSHLGVDSAPALSGASDTNSHKGLAMPWLRSLDGLNTHDDAYLLSMSGGVTTANVLPGSANAIGGQAFTIKLRPTAERSSSAMLLEPPFTLNGSYVDPSQRPRWRQMKHACGENPSRVYSGTRMDTQWAFRQAYNTARLVKEKQDAFCAKAEAGQWTGLGEFPEDLQWEALVDVLRGRVKIQNHCYEAVDFDGMIRLTNEFKFPISTFHHAHEAYLVPELLKKAYGKPPAIAMFATHARFKREAYRGSEFAPAILADNDIDVVMKSDHPVLNSRHLIYEAQQAHYFGLPENLALASVTTTPAKAMGQDHRVGHLIEGYDADVLVWDSHPLALGAAPIQVWVDGIKQLEKPHVSPKPAASQRAPETPDFTAEIIDAVKYEGLPPLEATEASSDVVVFFNVGSVLLKEGDRVAERFSAAEYVVTVEKGRIICMGECLSDLSRSDATYIDLEGGSVSPSFVSCGTSLGLTHISGEASTNDGRVFDPLRAQVPAIIEDDVIKAVDGLVFASRDALLAYRYGVTSSVTVPMFSGFLGGLSTVINPGAAHKLVSGAVIQDVAALHIALSMSSPSSVSTQIATLRGLLLGRGKGDTGKRFAQVVAGEMPLVVNVESADIIASLLVLKKEVESVSGTRIRLVLSGATEAHLLAKEIGEAGVGVLTQQRPYPHRWEERRILSGPPLSPTSAIAELVKHNVTVGLQMRDTSQVRNTAFEMRWAQLESNGIIGHTTAYELVTTNVEKLLGVKDGNMDMIATRGGSGFSGKIVAIISARDQVVRLV
ncbi:unnamed protein product [Mycena citricolor]|uniref:Amidohydrolase-related domain-containing protein n=1 Tax=Mycena citricolor TaxID=2018698 RepID=A0AAD2Q3R2_9AGAR|nr:unnamed protein product [Mycena citricolor]